MIVAVHVRRAKSFKVNIGTVSCYTLGVGTRRVIQVVHEHSGIFSKLPMSTHIYFEGRATGDAKHVEYDTGLVTKEFYDSGGTARDVDCVTKTI